MAALSGAALFMPEISQNNESKSNQVIEHLFRHESAKVISHLTRVYGTSNLELVEDAVQESLIKAMQTWSFKGIPDNPTSWLMAVSRNVVLDQLRRKSNFIGKQDTILVEQEFLNGETSELEIEDPAIFEDDQLRMIFACCHPAISSEYQIVLTLKILGGFSKSEIAKALLKKDDAIAKAYTRAKKKLREYSTKLEVPPESEIKNRLSIVVKIIYLLFNEGYTASSGEELIKQDVCIEALRLNNLLLNNILTAEPEVHALQALMYFQVSRFDARINDAGELLTLDRQDRSRWHQGYIDLGIEQLGLAANGVQLTEYHIQASIACFHCVAVDFESTNWKGILTMYDFQMQMNPAPVVALNRVVVINQLYGPENALEEFEELNSNELDSYYLYYAVLGDIMEKLNANQKAASAYEKAKSLTNNSVEITYLEAKIKELIF